MRSTRRSTPEELFRRKPADNFSKDSNSADSETRKLVLAHAIVTAEHGGTLTVSNEAGKGNTFSIRLPVLGKSTMSAFAAGSN
jgi:K+-sensing histidine kinase KdpD